MANNLRPASSINDLRTQAHMLLSARLESLDLTPLLIYTLGTNIPTSIIPYLIWQYDMMVPSVPMQVLGANPLVILQNALPLHKIMGAPGSIAQAFNISGYPGITFLEGQNAWGGTSYPSNQGWAVFRISLGGVGSGVLFSQQIGTANGINTSFALPVTPTGSSLRVFQNGLLLRPTIDYTFSGAVLTTTFVPVEGSVLSVAMRNPPMSSGILTELAIIANFFKPARCLLDEITYAFPLYFDSAVPTVSGLNLILPHTPDAPLYLELYRNGAYQTPELDYSISGATVTPTLAPGSDSFQAFGTYAGSGSAVNFADDITPTGVINGSNTTFTLPSTPNPASSLKLYLNDLLMKQGEDYTLATATITYTSAPPTGSAHIAFYRY
jgi:hypothetical protein